MSKNKSLIISIEGNIGSGKSTFIKKLREKYGENKDFYFVDEPVDEWTTVSTEDGKNLIENFYGDMKRYAYIFQNFAYITRLQKLYKAVNEHKDKIIITERSVESDRYLFAKMLYESGHLNKMEWQVYLSWFGFLNLKVNEIIYIKTDVDNCMFRIKTRNRSGEDNITNEYITQLNNKHEEWLFDRNDVTVLDGNKNIYKEGIFEEHLEKCHLFGT
jgi:deoxyadenosine/deoxycytidine kinase